MSAGAGQGAARRPTKGDRVEAIDDASLVERARGGDLWAEEQLYRRHGKAVAHKVARLLGSKQEVPDVVQDTFLYAYSQLNQLREPSKFRAWLMGIAVMRVRRVIRRRRLQRRFGLDKTTEDAALSTLAPTQWSPEARAQLATIDAILKTLAPDERISWMLRYVDGHSFEEVSEITKTSISTARRRCLAAHDKIQQQVRFKGEVDD